MNRKVTSLALGTRLIALCYSAEAQQPKKVSASGIYPEQTV
jgi:hypothetical protein